jgi:hypothetical protein
MDLLRNQILYEFSVDNGFLLGVYAETLRLFSGSKWFTPRNSPRFLAVRQPLNLAFTDVEARITSIRDPTANAVRKMFDNVPQTL